MAGWAIVRYVGGDGAASLSGEEENRMGTWIPTLLMLAAIGQPTFVQKAQPKPVNRVAQADALYAQRDDLAHGREAIRLLQQARAADRANFEAAWRTAKFCYYLAAHTS